MVKHLNLFLATRSPRRIELMQQAGFDFTLVDNDADESYPEGLAPIVIPQYISTQKALANSDVLKRPEDLIIAADCIVVYNDLIIGKPRDRADAIEILSLLSGKTHQVMTGVCLKSLTQTIVFAEVADVTFDEISQEEIEYYIDIFKPYDKAGAYGIQDWLGYCKIISITGTQPNIMGLPINRVYSELISIDREFEKQ